MRETASFRSGRSGVIGAIGTSSRARRHGRIPTLLFDDLDDLELIDDLHGHASGNTLIRLVGTALESIPRETEPYTQNERARQLGRRATPTGIDVVFEPE